VPIPVNSPNIDLPHRCSRVFFALNFFLLVCTAGVIGFSGISIGVRTAAYVMVGCASYLVWRQFSLLNALSGILIRQGKLQLVVNDRRLAVAIVGDCFVTENIVAFSCRAEQDKRLGKTMHIVVLSDSMPSEERRLLRVLLKTGRLG